MYEKLMPAHIDPFRFAEQRLALDGIVKVADMKRLQPTVVSSQDAVAVNLQFGVDEQGIHYLKGHLETHLTLQCQRCMEPFIYEIISNFILGVVNTLNEENALPEYYEPVLVKEGMLALNDLIEDEIILNLPIIPRHEPEHCKVKLLLTESGWEHETGKHPFHVLKLLKRKER